jgi:flagellar biosynthesis protein FliR
MIELVLAGLRGAAAIGVLAAIAGGIPRLVVVGLAAFAGAWSALAVPPVADPSLVIAARGVALGAAMGVVAALPLVAARVAGQLVDRASASPRGPYAALFGLLAAAVFVGIDGHVTAITAIVDSHARLPALADVQPRVLDTLGTLVAIAVRLAIPWLVTAAVVELAVGAGLRVAARSASHVPAAAAVPAALAMMTAALVSTLAVAIAVAIRGGL